MQEEFEYLETVTVYPTAGFAYTEHKTPVPGAERGMYRVARVTSATDTTSAVQTLANTFMRMCDTSSFEWQAVDSMVEYARRIVSRANFSRAKVRRAWGIILQHARYAQLCRRQSERWNAGI